MTSHWPSTCLRPTKWTPRFVLNYLEFCTKTRRICAVWWQLAPCSRRATLCCSGALWMDAIGLVSRRMSHTNGRMKSNRRLSLFRASRKLFAYVGFLNNFTINCLILVACQVINVTFQRIYKHQLVNLLGGLDGRYLWFIKRLNLLISRQRVGRICKALQLATAGGGGRSSLFHRQPRRHRQKPQHWGATFIWEWALKLNINIGFLRIHWCVAPNRIKRKKIGNFA